MDKKKSAEKIVQNIEKQIVSIKLDRKLIVIMAKLNAEIGNTDKSLTYLRQYIELYPDEGIPYYEYAEMLLKIFLKTNEHKYLKDAGEQYEIAIEKQPDLMKARLRLLAIRLLADDPDPDAVREILGN